MRVQLYFEIVVCSPTSGYFGAANGEPGMKSSAVAGSNDKLNKRQGESKQKLLWCHGVMTNNNIDLELYYIQQYVL